MEENTYEGFKTAIAVCTLPPNFGFRDYLTYQDKMIRVYAAKHGYYLLKVVRESMRDKEYLNQLVDIKRLVKLKKVDLILVQDKQRLFEDNFDYLNFEAYCNFYGVDIIAVNDTVQLEDYL